MSSPEDTLDLVESPKLAPVSAGVDVIVPTDKAEAEAKAREKGWVRVTPYEYSRYDNEAPKDPTDRSWLCQAAVYEWNDEYGEVGPPNPELEKELYFSEYKNRAGDLAMYGTFLVKHRGPYQVEHINSFEGAGLHPVMLENVKLCGYERPTPVQAHTIPAVLMGHDVIASAQTGSGKTAAYLIPILSRLMGKAKALAAPRPTGPSFDPATDRVRAEPLVLIICPSRELAAQIFDEARRLCYRTMLRPCVAYGGASPKAQREELERGCDILIGTPGRLVDFVTKPHLLSLNRVKYTVIDEADELLQYDWEDEMSKLLSGGDTGQDTDHLYMMFSATFTAAARKLAREYMSAQHMRFEIGRAGSTHTNVKQVVIYVDPAYKLQAVWDLLMSDQEPGRTIIFVNSKRTADMLDDYLYNLHLPTTSIHADRTQREREDSLRAFRIGSAPILVATGVTARGIDVKHVKHVINYDLPSASYGGIQEYVHRIGRTARIGNPGLATSFYSEHNEDIAPDLVKILMENNQVVPECLQGFAPSDGELVWDEENSDPEDDPEEDGGAPLSGYGTGSVNGDATSKSDEPATFTATESVGGDAW